MSKPDRGVVLPLTERRRGRLSTAGIVKVCLIALLGLVIVVGGGFMFEVGPLRMGGWNLGVWTGADRSAYLGYATNASSGSIDAADSAQIKQVKLLWSGGQLSLGVGSADSTAITVQDSQQGSTYQARWGLSGDTLYLLGPDVNMGCSVHDVVHCSMNVELPAKVAAALQSGDIEVEAGSASLSGLNFAQNLRVENDAGSTTMDAINTAQMSLEVNAGSFNGTRVNATTLSSELNAGKLDLSGQFNTIKPEVDAGAATITSIKAPSSMNVEVDAGILNLNIPDNPGFTIHLDRSAGSFDTTFPNVSGGFSLDDDSTNVYGNGQSVYNIEIDAGAIHLNKI